MQRPIKILVVTGGVAGPDGAPEKSQELLDTLGGMPQIRYERVHVVAEQRELPMPYRDTTYDAVLFFAMPVDPVSPLWSAILKKGKGFFFLHHAIASFQASPALRSVIGGQFHFPSLPPKPSDSAGLRQAQTYSVIDRDHPITCASPAGFSLNEEGYDKLEILGDVHVLMESDAPKVTPQVAWTWSYQGKRVFYLLPGHGNYQVPRENRAYQNEEFNRILLRGTLWVAGRL